MLRFRSALLVAMLALPLGAEPAAKELKTPVPTPVHQAFGEFRAAAIHAHTNFLASDLLEGRGPGTRGDELARGYLAAQLESMGLAPAGDDGTYFQKVSLLGITTDPAKSTVRFAKGGATALGPLAVPRPVRRRRPVAEGERDARFRRDLRRPWCGGPRVRMGRLQGDRHPREDAGDAGRRSAGERGRARSVQGPGAHLLRALDLQVRDRRREGSGSGDPDPHRPRRRLRLAGRPELVDRRTGLREEPAGTARALVRGLDHREGRRESLQGRGLRPRQTHPRRSLARLQAGRSSA